MTIPPGDWRDWFDNSLHVSGWVTMPGSDDELNTWNTWFEVVEQ
jgi:hypothetical protein